MDINGTEVVVPWDSLLLFAGVLGVLRVRPVGDDTPKLFDLSPCRHSRCCELAVLSPGRAAVTPRNPERHLNTHAQPCMRVDLELWRHTSVDDTRAFIRTFLTFHISYLQIEFGLKYSKLQTTKKYMCHRARVANSCTMKRKHNATTCDYHYMWRQIKRAMQCSCSEANRNIFGTHPYMT